MASSTYKSFLMMKGSSAYEKLIDIKDYPDLGGTPENLETTTLSNKMQTFTPGVQSVDSMDFTANYTKEDFDALKALEGVVKDYAVWFGGSEASGEVTPTGSDGKFKFSGVLSVHVTGQGVNSVREMSISIVPSSEITTE